MFLWGKYSIITLVYWKQKILDKSVIAEQVRQATLKLSNNGAAGPDRVFTEFVKYAYVSKSSIIYPRITKSCPRKSSKARYSFDHAEKNHFDHPNEMFKA